MKKLLSLSTFMYFSSLLFGQDIREGFHITNFDVEVIKCDINGITANPPEKVNLEPERKFRIIKEVNDEYIIQVLHFPSSFDNHEQLNLMYEKTKEGELLYFKMTKDQYKLNAERLERRGNFTVGASTTLIKIRPGRKEPKDGYTIYSDFGNDFNIGVSAGWKFKPYRKTQLAYSFVFGLSYTSVKVTPYSTKDFIESESNQSCITFSAGFVFEYNKFQVSAFSGLDLMPGEIGRHWIYRNRPWIGLGFGYQIFRAEGEKAQIKD